MPILKTNVLAFSLFIFLMGIGEMKAEKLKVLATTSFLADMAKNIAGDRAEVVSLMPIGGDPHIYDPVPGDALKVAQADLIFKNGFHLEGWLNEMIENSGNNGPVVTVTDGIDVLKSADYDNAYDPHAWMNLLFGIIYIDNMKDALVTYDPANREYYEANHRAYRKELEALDKFILKQIQLIPENRRILITSHDAFRYFGNRYGLQVESVLGTSTEADVQTGDMLHLVQVIKEKGVPSIFIESTINPKLLKQLAGDIGIVIGGKLFADSLGDKESGADTYMNMLKQNAMLIVQGLTAPVGSAAKEESNSYIFIILGFFALAFGWVYFRLRPSSETGIGWKDYELSIKGLSVSYDRKTALANVYLTIKPGYVTGLIGGNGSGKSTLFKSILGLIEPDAGNISLNGRDIEDIRKYVSYIPQKEEIDWSFPATVMDVVMLGRYPHRGVFEAFKREDKEKATIALKQMGIDDLQRKQIGELSGGQQQRVFIARALCQEAEVYLFDEPFVGVDITTEKRIMEIVKGLAASGKMVVIIHHDLAKVKDYFDEVIMINQRLVAAGPTEEVFTDENIKVTYGGRLTILQKTEALQ
ncbi:zinc ABC transporter substrate-binding protein [bacterium]|nr:zinc ABC transporter substrate-binding protein [bacterium]